MKKILAMILALLMAAGSFAACGEKEPETKAPVDVNTPGESNTETEKETQKPTPNWDAVDKTSLNGMTVNICGREEDKLDFDGYTSDILEDAIFDRNRLIENILECEILVNKVAETDDTTEFIKNAVNAGDGSVDLGSSNSGALMTDGWLVPFNYIEDLDMTQPWWDTSLMEDMTIHGMAYFGLLDFMFKHYDDMYVLFYNKNMLAKYQLEDPYDLYKNQQWTIDRFIEMVEAATQDTNGDGMMTDDDDFGLNKGAGIGPGEGMPMLHASGHHMIDWDQEAGTFVFNMIDERYVAVLEKITPLYSQYGLPHGEKESFGNGTLLFLGERLSYFEDLRETEDNYGLIMYPRYDYVGETYVTSVGNSFTLPRDIGDDNEDGVDDYAEIGQFLQASGAYTYDVLIDIYKEKNVVGKGLRDERSAEMFYEMINMRSTEFCAWFLQGYGFNTTINTQTDILEGKSTNSYASAAQIHMKKFNAMAKRLADLILEQVDKLELES